MDRSLTFRTSSATRGCAYIARKRRYSDPGSAGPQTKQSYSDQCGARSCCFTAALTAFLYRDSAEACEHNKIERLPPYTFSVSGYRSLSSHRLGSLHAHVATRVRWLRCVVGVSSVASPLPSSLLGRPPVVGSTARKGNAGLRSSLRSLHGLPFGASG